MKYEIGFRTIKRECNNEGPYTFCWHRNAKPDKYCSEKNCPILKGKKKVKED